jgi:hypothetical protein
MNKDFELAEEIVKKRCRADSGLYTPKAVSIYFKTEVRYIPEKGYRGVFACEYIPKDAIIGVNGGRIVDNIDGIPDQIKYGVLIDIGVYLMPSNYNLMEDSWFINHSCDPNVEGIGGRLSIAKQEIEPGDELTVDYAPLVAGEENWFMNCNCGSHTCRKVIKGDDWQNPTIAKRLWKSFSPYIQHKIINSKIYHQKTMIRG